MLGFCHRAPMITSPHCVMTNEGLDFYNFKIYILIPWLKRGLKPPRNDPSFVIVVFASVTCFLVFLSLMKSFWGVQLFCQEVKNGETRQYCNVGLALRPDLECGWVLSLHLSSPVLRCKRSECNVRFAYKTNHRQESRGFEPQNFRPSVAMRFIIAATIKRCWLKSNNLRFDFKGL